MRPAPCIDIKGQGDQSDHCKDPYKRINRDIGDLHNPHVVPCDKDTDGQHKGQKPQCCARRMGDLHRLVHHVVFKRPQAAHGGLKVLGVGVYRFAQQPAPDRDVVLFDRGQGKCV